MIQSSKESSAQSVNKISAAIAILESGTHDLFPEPLNQVMAMAAGNSKYVAESLLQNPTEADRPYLPPFRGMRRIYSDYGSALALPTDSTRASSDSVSTLEIPLCWRQGAYSSYGSTLVITLALGSC